MEKLTLTQLYNAFYKFNKEHNITKQFEEPSINGVIVFKESNWKTKYSLESRSYIINSGNKYFISGMGGNSIFGSNLDGTETCIRLDHYMYRYNWEVDYCYLLKEDNHD